MVWFGMPGPQLLPGVSGRGQGMDISVPAALRALSTGGAAANSLASWWKKSKGDARALVGELKDNLSYLDMVADDEIDLGEVIEKISVAEFKRLSREGFNFNKLKKSRISEYTSLAGTDMAAWCGKETEQLIESIYEKTSDLIIRYPHVKDNKKYRWKVRVNNIRKRIWLLLKHINS